MNWARLRARLEELLELDAGERATRLAALEIDEPALATELRELLDHDASADAFLERPGDALPRPAAPSPGTRFGRYRLVELLGTGGMGSVWLAAGDRPTRHVALKMLATDVLSQSESWRFRYEMDVLASLSHPGIARLFDAGDQRVGDRIVLWFAMELVEDARDLVSWARDHDLDRAARLTLFDTLCDAVRYGHRRGVVHRDLKPANVLVDGDGRLKLIDFGVARAVGGPELDRSRRTQPGQIVGTLQYMAPEQLAGNPEDVDVRCDVYALGVLLYELLTDRSPFDFDNRTLTEIARIAREDEPRRPSTLCKDLAGDLEWILLKALAKSPDRRYQSVDALTDDLRRFHAHEPILARAPSRIYALRRYARRHARQLVVVGAILLGIIVAGVGLVRGARDARAGEALAQDEKRNAERSAARHVTVLRLVERLFDGIDGSIAGRDVRMLDLLDAAALDRGVIDDPAVEFAVRALRGSIYRRLEEYGKAAAELERAVTLFPAFVPDELDHVRFVRAVAELGDALCHTGDTERGERKLRSALVDAENDSALRRFTLSLLVNYLREKGAFAEQQELATELAALASPGSQDAADARHHLALAVSGLGDTERALELFEEAWQLQRQLNGDDHPWTLNALRSVAAASAEAGLHGRAEAIYPDVVAKTRELFGPSHTETLSALNNWAMLAFARGDRAAATDRLTAIVTAYDDRGLPPTLPHLIAIGNCGSLHMQRGNYATAEPILRRAATLSETLFSPDDLHGMTMRFNLGACLAWMKRFDEAEPILLREFARMQAVLPEGHGQLAKGRRTIADAYRVNGDPDAAARWRQPPPP